MRASQRIESIVHIAELQVISSFEYCWLLLDCYCLVKDNNIATFQHKNAEDIALQPSTNTSFFL